jgi:hypothetical protein
MGSGTFRTIGALAERCGNYAWVESRLFELTGSWVTAPGDPDIRVRCSEMSAQHAFLAAEWQQRLPVRAGVDRRALVVAPPGPLDHVLGVLDAEPSLPNRLAGLVTVVLPRLLAAYADHLAQASAVNEGPVLATLGLASLWTAQEIDLGLAVLQGELHPAEMITVSSEFCQGLESPFEGSRDVFPAARPS